MYSFYNSFISSLISSLVSCISQDRVRGGWERKEGRHTEGGRENNTDRTMRRHTHTHTHTHTHRSGAGKGRYSHILLPRC